MHLFALLQIFNMVADLLLFNCFLIRCMQAAAVPFIGFGFLDNFLMIVFGDLIDSTLCVALNFSTMAAAAIGNTISDGAGIWSGQWLESKCKALGF